MTAQKFTLDVKYTSTAHLSTPNANTMISSFRDKRTAAVFAGKTPKGFPSVIAPIARRKLRMVDAAVNLNDLRSPPGNHLEALHGDREGQYSIRINDQWRICFVWRDGSPHEVEIVDYH